MIFKSLKAHASRHALLTLAFCTLVPLPALADMPVFAPAAPWEVNAGQLSTVRGLKPMKMPCVISTEYDNGFVVRFSGGGGKMMALAIDFRQDVFKQGKQYDTMVTIGGAYVKQVTASAFTSSTLIFNLRPIPDFYNAAQNGGEMEIEIEGNALKFALGNIGKTYTELEGCYGGNNAAEPVQPVNASKAPVAKVESAPVEEARTEMVQKKSAAKPVKEATVKAEPQPQPLSPQDVAAQPLPKEVAEKKLPQSFDEIVQNGNEEAPTQPTKLKLTQVTPKPSQNPTEAEAPVAPRAQNAAVKPVPRAPEDRADVSPSKDITPMPATAKQAAPIVSRATDDGMSTIPPIKSDGAAVAAAQQPVKGFVPMTPAPVAAMPLPSAQPQQIARNAPTPITPPAPAMWEARAGEDMKIVLSRWAERAGYDLQWQSEQDGKVAQDVKLSGSFEDAVGQLLAENSAATGMGAHVETTAGGKKDIGPKIASAPEPTPKAPPVQATIPALHEEWSAAPGSNIQSVLDQWSSKAGVAVVWQSYMNVAVKQPLQVNGTYEEAVQTLLDQYSGDSRRPVGQLNIDPETGTRTLLVDMSS